MERLGCEIKGRDAEDAVRLRIRHVDNSKVPPSASLSKSDPCTVVTGTILERTPKDLFGFALSNAMAVQVRFAGFRIDVEADVQARLGEIAKRVR